MIEEHCQGLCHPSGPGPRSGSRGITSETLRPTSITPISLQIHCKHHIYLRFSNLRKAKQQQGSPSCCPGLQSVRHARPSWETSQDRRLQEQSRGAASPTLSCPHPPSLGLDCNQQGRPSRSPDPSHRRGLFSGAAVPLPPPASLSPLLELGARAARIAPSHWDQGSCCQAVSVSPGSPVRQAAQHSRPGSPVIALCTQLRPGTRQGTRISKGLSREPLWMRRAGPPDSAFPSLQGLPASTPWLLLGLKLLRASTIQGAVSMTPPPRCPPGLVPGSGLGYGQSAKPATSRP